MKTPVEFDYDLWTTEDGKCMVRVKGTGEVTEVDRDVMRLLRAEEKKLRRSMTGVPISGCEDETATLLTLDYVNYQGGEDMSPAWLEDPHDFTGEIMSRMLTEDFLKGLTQREKDVYDFCIRDGGSQQEYAGKAGLSVSRVCKIVGAIRKKAKIFF